MGVHVWSRVRGGSELSSTDIQVLIMQYFQFKETPQSAAEKGFAKLNPLTPGSGLIEAMLFMELTPVHGYSMLRPTLNQDYFHEIYDAAEDFGVGVEGHRECDDSSRADRRYRDRPRSVRDGFGVYRDDAHGGQRVLVQACREERGNEVWHNTDVHG